MMSRNDLIQYVMQANHDQYDKARQVVRDWQKQNPGDPEPEDLLFLLDCQEREYHKAKAAWNALQDKLHRCGPAALTQNEIADIGLSARGIEGVAEARKVVYAWERAHPDVPRMYDLFEQLYHMEDAARGMAEEAEAARAEASAPALAA